MVYLFWIYFLKNYIETIGEIMKHFGKQTLFQTSTVHFTLTKLNHITTADRIYLVVRANFDRRDTCIGVWTNEHHLSSRRNFYEPLTRVQGCLRWCNATLDIKINKTSSLPFQPRDSLITKRIKKLERLF